MVAYLTIAKAKVNQICRILPYLREDASHMLGLGVGMGGLPHIIGGVQPHINLVGK